MNNMFNGMFGSIAPGMCRISMSGGIAVKTSNGYKSYNVKTKRLTNCTNFVFDVGEEFFFVIPTNKVAIGDIILVGGKPRCVIAVEADTIKVINYEDSTVENILPERHVFMGNTYFYGKIVSMFGDSFDGGDKKKGKNNMQRMMSYMMMSEMMKRHDTNNSGMGNVAMMYAMCNGSMGNMFEGMFDDMTDDAEEEAEATEEDAE